MRVLALDDDEETLDLIGSALRRAGHDVVLVSEASGAEQVLDVQTFDVLVLDVMLGETSGLDLCLTLRRDGCSTPILFLSARGTVRARVDGLEAGGDDYLPKPFAVRELVARVKALGRRGPALRKLTWRLRDVVLDFDRRRASVADF
jgi:two-component system OmpR family response regulator